MSTRIQLKNVRLAYGHGLWTKSKPPKADASAKEKYRVCFILGKDHPQLPELRAIIKAEMEAKFGKKADAVLKAAELSQKSCLRDGDTNTGDGFAGNMYVAANSETRPSVFNHDKSPITEDDDIIRSGYYVNASIDIYAFDNVAKGNSAGLRGVQFYRKGESFGSGGAAGEDEFDEISAPPEDDQDPLTA